MSDNKPFFPPEITGLPEADMPMAGWTAYISQAENHQVMFFDCEADTEVPPHSHKAQFGVIIEGEMELTAEGKKTVVRKGDHYYIPSGVVHSARMITRVRAIDFFEDVSRWKEKAGTGTGSGSKPSV